MTGVLSALMSTTKGHQVAEMLSYLNTSGVTFTLAVIVIAIIIYWIRNIQNRMKGIDLSLLYKTVPPD